MNSNVDELYLEVTVLSKNLIVGCFYTPNVITDVYNAHLSTVERLVGNYSENEFLIMGDFNLGETV